MAQTILHKAKLWPVTAAWHEANTVPFPDLAAMTREQLRREQYELLAQSDQRHLSELELARLKAANNHFDVRTAIDFLGGRPHTDFGFDGVDQVHGNRWTAPCGCELHLVFDHHKRAEPDLVVYPHTSRYVCPRHVHLKDDLAALHARVSADSQPVEE